MFTTVKNAVPMSVWFMLLSAMGFALMSACVKEVSNLGIPVLEIVAARAIVSLFLSYIDIKRKKLAVWGHNKPLLIARGVVGAITLIFVYYSVSTLPLAEATVLQYLHPVFTAILALFILKEVIQRSTVTCIVMSLLGLFIIIQPNLQLADSTMVGGSQYPWISIGSGILGALGSSIAYILVKKLTVTDDSSVIIFYFPLVALPISLALLGSDFVMPTLPALGLLVLIGIFTQIGQVGLTKAFNCDDANKASGYAYVQIIFSVAIGWAYFSEVPVITTFIGGGLIMFGALVNVLWKR